MISPERGPRDPEGELVRKEEKVEKEVKPEDKELPRFMSEPEESGKKDKEELDKFMQKAESDALLQLFEGKDKEALLKVVERHDKEFAPQKMAEIEKDAKEYIEKMPDALRKTINDPDALKELAESFAGKEEQDVRHELETALRGVEKDAKFRQWVEDQYVIRRIRSFMGPEKPPKQEGEFNEEEQSRIQSRISEEVEKAVEKIKKGDFYELSNELYDPAKGSFPIRRIREVFLEIKKRIEAGEKIKIFENTNEDFRRIYEKLQEKAEKEERLENPYREIERRLISAQQKLEQEGLHEDAEALNQTINRLKRETAGGKDPASSEILLWAKNSDSRPPHEPTRLEKLAEKIDSWMLKIPLIGRYMSRDYRESVRSAGGVIIRADGSREEFGTFTHFKKPGEKTHTEALFGGDYHYVVEPQPGDEVVSWEPSERGKKIIMEALGGSNVSTPNKFASSLGKSNIEYRSSEYSTANVEFEVKRGEDLENRQLYSTAKLSIFPPPVKGIRY